MVRLRLLAAVAALLLWCPGLFAQGTSTGVCSGQAAISVAAAGTSQIVPLVTGQQIRICHLSLSSSVAITVQLVSGTGSNCGTGTANITGAYQNVVTFAISPGPVAGPFAPSGAAVCLVITGTSPTVGGVVTWTVQ
jgi:hypothetical protein